jgi:glyoxylase-like metal-dependent hydrolase (beta-lactamase superfamily II)
VDDRSVVSEQPLSPREWVEAKEAMVSCPTNSIGVVNAPMEFREAHVQFPMLVAENVYYCGYTSKDSYGASSFFIQRPEGNILIDSPRFNAALVKELEAMGGIKTMILTHKDDVADHELFAENFHCERIIHIDEVYGSTREVEKILNLTETLSLEPEIKLIPVPGHTKGHIAILYKDKYLFTGDHIFVSGEPISLESSQNVCWYSWEEQIASTKKLLDFSFEWVLPGHGGWGYLPADLMKAELQKLITCMEKNERT